MTSSGDEIAEILIDQGRICARVQELANQIAADYEGKELVLLATLKGAVVFLADLMRRLNLPVRLEFAQASSYGDRTESSGHVCLRLDRCGDLRGSHVLIIEDIVDTGRTIAALVQAITNRGAASVKTCCLLDKPSRRVVHFQPDYVGFEIPDKFVVGYGLDCAEKYRNLPFVAVLKSHEGCESPQ